MVIIKTNTMLTLPDMSKASPQEHAAELIKCLGKEEAINFCEEMLDEWPQKREHFEQVKKVINE